MKKRIILITGVAGFIGSNLARYFLEHGHAVYGVDDLSLGKKESVPSGVKFVPGDINDPRTLRSVESRSIDSVFHLAGQSGAELSFTDPIFDLKSNALSSLTLLNWMGDNGIRNLVHASSVAVYGETSNKFEALHETMPTRPISPYAVSKLATEFYLRQLASKYGVSSASLRLFNVYGPNQDLNRGDQGILSIYLGQALETGKVVVKGRGNRERDFVHVADVVRAFDVVSTGLSKPHTVLNVSSGIRTSLTDALRILSEEFRGKLEIKFQSGTPGDLPSTCGNSEKIKKLYGWSPTVEFEDGFRETIKYHLRHD